MVIEISFLLLLTHPNPEKISYNLKLFYCFQFSDRSFLVGEIDCDQYIILKTIQRNTNNMRVDIVNQSKKAKNKRNAISFEIHIYADAPLQKG